MARRTTSATGRSERARRAFTLIEVLIVIALIGAVTAAVVTDFASLVDSASKPTAYERVRDAVEAGRIAARSAGEPVRVVWVPDSGALRVIGPVKNEDFVVPGAEAVTFAFPDDDDGSERPLEALVFHPSGAAMPAVLDIAVVGSHARYRLEIFSAALSPEPTR